MISRCVSGAWPTPGCYGRGRWGAWHGAVRGGGVPASPAGAPGTIAGLSEHRTLGYLHNGQLQKWQLYDPQQGEVRFTPEAWLVQDDFAAIAAAAQQGMGIAWLPDWLVAQALADGTLQQVLAPSDRVRFAIHAVWPEGPWLPQKTRVTIDALRAGLGLA